MILRFLEDWVWELGSKPAEMTMCVWRKPEWSYLPPIFVAVYKVPLPTSPPLIKLWSRDYNMQMPMCPVTFLGVCMALVVLIVKSFVELEHMLFGLIVMIVGIKGEGYLLGWRTLGGPYKLGPLDSWVVGDSVEIIERKVGRRVTFRELYNKWMGIVGSAAEIQAEVIEHTDTYRQFLSAYNEAQPVVFSVHDLPGGFVKTLIQRVTRSEGWIKAIVVDYNEVLEQSGVQAAIHVDPDGRPRDPALWKEIYLATSVHIYQMNEDPAPTAYVIGREILAGRRRRPSVSHDRDASAYHRWREVTEVRNLPQGGSNDLEYQTRVLEAAGLQNEAMREVWREHGRSWAVPIPAVTEPPTTACWTCGAIVPIEDTYSPKNDDRPFEQRRCLCGSCFRVEEEAGRVKGV